MGLFTKRRDTAPPEERGNGWVTINGNTYPLASGYAGMVPNTTSMAAGRPQVSGDLASIVAAAQPHSVTSAAVLARSLVLSQLWPQFADRGTHELFGDKTLAPLENPAGVTMTLPRLFMDAESLASYSGTVLFAKRPDGVRLLRVDYTTVLLGSDSDPMTVADAAEAPPDERREALEWALDADIIGYSYRPTRNSAPQFLDAKEVALWAPEPHPLSHWLGASWVTSVVRELQGDIQADTSVDKYFEHGATPRLMYIMGEDMTPKETEEWRALNEDDHAGVLNGSKSIYQGGVKDVKVIGTTLKDLGLKEYRGELETRLAARSRVPAVVLGISEGMQGSSLNAGNYGQTRRLWADGWFTPYSNGLLAALQQIVPAPKSSQKHPNGSYLSHDPARVMFLQEDRKDAADILGVKSRTIRALTDGGYTPESIVDAVVNDDLRKLKHSGLTSVQLVPPGTGETPS